MKSNKHKQLFWLSIFIVILTLLVAFFFAYKIKSEEEKEYFVQLGRANVIASELSSTLEEDLNIHFKKMSNAVFKNDISTIVAQIDGLMILNKGKLIFPQNFNESFFKELSNQVSTSKQKIYQEINNLIKAQNFSLADSKIKNEEKSNNIKDSLLFLHLKSILLLKQEKFIARKAILINILLSQKKDVLALPWIFWESVFISYLESSPKINKSYDKILLEMFGLIKSNYLSNDLDYFYQKMKAFNKSNQFIILMSSEHQRLLNLTKHLAQITKTSIESKKLNFHPLPILKKNQNNFQFTLKNKVYLMQNSLHGDNRIIIILSWKRIKNLLNKKLAIFQLNSGFQYKLSSEGTDKAILSRALNQYPNIYIKLKLSDNWITPIKRRNQNYFIILTFILIFILSFLYFLYKTITFQLNLAKMRSDFVTNVSHELRTPVAAIQLMSETLSNQSIKEERKLLEYYQLIHNDSRRLGNLINNVLDFSKLESGSRKYNIQEGSLLGMLEQVKQSYCVNTPSNNLMININSEDEEIIHKFDADSMEQIFSNIIENSIKYSKNDHDTNIKITINSKQTFITIIFEDNSRGINADDLPHVFEKFFRGGDLSTQNIKGNGLGLCIVKQLVEVHHGKVKIESVLDVGTKTIITFPKTT